MPYHRQNTARQRAHRKRVFTRFTRVADFGHELKGLGGIQTAHIRALKGSTFGPAGQVKQITGQDKQAIVQRLRQEGVL